MNGLDQPRSAPVTGVACDPHVALPDGTQRSLRFFTSFGASARVLDVGCGSGMHLKELAKRGFDVIGVEPDREAVEALRREGYDVVHGSAEELPFDDESFDAIVCSVVVPYTDERRAIAEWARVLMPQGEVRASYHGVAYALKQLVLGPGVRLRMYGGRTIANRCFYDLTGRRLPGFWGDTLYQSSARLRHYYRDCGLELRAEYVRPAMGGMRDVFFHHLQKSDPADK